mgnify:CR=1 FL=1|tara:strand:+ start:1099 stop:2055 length:957 start_codon:yes stop_codon:yes gene_type:complete
MKTKKYKLRKKINKPKKYKTKKYRTKKYETKFKKTQTKGKGKYKDTQPTRRTDRQGKQAERYSPVDFTKKQTLKKPVSTKGPIGIRKPVKPQDNIPAHIHRQQMFAKNRSKIAYGIWIQSYRKALDIELIKLLQEYLDNLNWENIRAIENKLDTIFNDKIIKETFHHYNISKLYKCWKSKKIPLYYEYSLFSHCRFSLIHYSSNCSTGMSRDAKLRIVNEYLNLEKKSWIATMNDKLKDFLKTILDEFAIDYTETDETLITYKDLDDLYKPTCPVLYNPGSISDVDKLVLSIKPGEGSSSSSSRSSRRSSHKSNMDEE